jgi:hypothetical protein
MDQQAASDQAMKEYNDTLKDGMIAFDKTLLKRETEIKDKLKAKLGSDLSDIKQLEQQARKILESGQQAHKDRYILYIYIYIYIYICIYEHMNIN